MDQVLCPSCRGKLPERGCYCPNCASQARCAVCREILEPGANACVECGALLDISNSGLAANGKLHSTPGLNRIRYEETKTSRSLDAEFTDTAVDSLSGPLASALTERPYVQGPRRSPGTTPQQTGPEVAQLGIPTIEQEAIIDATNYVTVEGTNNINPVAATPSGHTDPDLERLSSVFRQTGDTMVLDNSQLNARNKADAIRRLTYLALYFCEVRGEAKVSKERILNLARDIGWFDNNTSKVFNNAADLSVNGEQVSLRSTGRKVAQDFLKEIDNPTVVEPWSPGSSPRRTRSGRSSAKQETGSTKTPKATRQAMSNESKKVNGWLESYKSLPNQPSHKLLYGKSVAEQGMVALWCIRKATDDADKVVSTYLLAKFILVAFESKVDRGNLGTQLKKRKEEVVHLGKTQFQLNQTGMDYVDNILGQSP